MGSRCCMKCLGQFSSSRALFYTFCPIRYAFPQHCSPQENITELALPSPISFAILFIYSLMHSVFSFFFNAPNLIESCRMLSIFSWKPIFRKLFDILPILPVAWYFMIPGFLFCASTSHLTDFIIFSNLVLLIGW